MEILTTIVLIGLVLVLLPYILGWGLGLLIIIGLILRGIMKRLALFLSPK